MRSLNQQRERKKNLSKENAKGLNDPYGFFFEMKKKNSLKLTCGWMCFITDADPQCKPVCILVQKKGGKLIFFSIAVAQRCVYTSYMLMYITDWSCYTSLGYCAPSLLSSPAQECLSKVHGHCCNPVQKHLIEYLFIFGGWHIPYKCWFLNTWPSRLCAQQRGDFEGIFPSCVIPSSTLQKKRKKGFF